MTTLPVVVNAAGYVPQTPQSLNSLLIANVSAIDPGYTADLPGLLIEDISSTDTYALLQCDSSVAEIINSLTPYGANDFLLIQLGNVYGVQPQSNTNTSVYVQFTGPPGWVIAQGFVVSDGTYQYTIPNGGVVGAGGTSALLYAVATVPGSWAVPASTVVDLVTSVPTSVQPAPTVTNPSAGLPATGGETNFQYRARVLTAGLAASQGMSRYLRTLVQNVQGVQYRLVSVRQDTSTSLWEVICGGGDQYQVAYAIWQALFDINALVGSVMSVASITQATPGVVTTLLNHGYPAGEVIQFTGIVGMTELNGVTSPSIQAVPLTPTTFSLQTSDSIAAISETSGTVTVTALNPFLGLTAGLSYPVTISGVEPSGYCGTFTATITGYNTFTYPLGGSPGTATATGSYTAPMDTTGFGFYIGGGVLSPNLRNVTTDLLDYPDTYTITFVNPPQQLVAMTVTWNTTATSYVNPVAVAQAAQPALVDYINSIEVGQSINTLEMTSVFQTAVSGIIPPQLLTRLVFAVDIDGVSTPPVTGTGEVVGDPESYFYTTTAGVVVVQG